MCSLGQFSSITYVTSTLHYCKIYPSNLKAKTFAFLYIGAFTNYVDRFLPFWLHTNMIQTFHVQTSIRSSMTCGEVNVCTVRHYLNLHYHTAEVLGVSSVTLVAQMRTGQHDLTFAAHSCTAYQMEIFAQEFKPPSYFCN